MKAFPNFHEQGMNLRDYFAAKAMQIYLLKEQTGEDYPEAVDWLGPLSYEIADIMIKAREENDSSSANK